MSEATKKWACDDEKLKRDFLLFLKGEKQDTWTTRTEVE